MGTDMSKHSQCDKILAYMQEHTFINTKIARTLFRCERLASRINDTKHRGVNVGRVMRSYTDEDGNTVRYAEYYLITEDAG
jgi:hypothetical protein